MPFGVAHTIILKIAQWASGSFFDKIEVINGDNVPKTGPVIIASTHHNMSVDPVVLSASFPHARKLHYWAKSTLFGNPIAKAILLNAGNVPVYRKAKDNQALYKGTFDVLAVGEVVAIFPEGTSYTEPHVMQVKDGVSWTALEYYKWLQTPEGLKCKERDLVVVPASIVYTDKSRYRSSAVVEYGRPIHIAEYAAKFLSGVEGAEKAAVKTLTKDIGTQLVDMTINAPDWETLLAARMARRLLWTDDKQIPLQSWVEVNQTLADLFCAPSPSPTLHKIKSDLLTYYTLLKSSRLDNASLAQLPLPRTLDPSVPAPLPSRIRTVWVLLVDTIASVLRLPFFLLPLLVHIPAYLAGRLGARLAEDEEETVAQNKIVFGLLSLALVYPAMFIFLWALLWLSPPGFLVAAFTLAGFTAYHTRLVDDNYAHAKRLLAAWRVLIGVWGPRQWDLPVSKLKAYTEFIPPPPNPWLDVNKPAKEEPPAPTASAPASASASLDKAKSPKDKDSSSATTSRRKKLPSRALVRHVLRARILASHSLSTFLAEIERSSGDVPASEHLARIFGSSSQPITGTSGEAQVAGSGSGFKFLPTDSGPSGSRSAKEVVRYLRERGARIAQLEESGEGDWAADALSSGDEGAEDSADDIKEHLQFVSPGK